MSENSYTNLKNAIDSGKKAVMITTLKNNDKFQKKVLYTKDELSSCNNDFSSEIFEKAEYALKSGNLEFIKGDISYLIEPYFPEPKLVIFGGGHIAKPLVEFGVKAGFSVTVIDDRPSFANNERFPLASNVICESFEKCFDLLTLNESVFVVIVTRGHKYDKDCLRQVLKYNTAYTGMIGSKRRVKSVMDEMLSEGFSKDKIDKVNSPIGLDIGAVTPDEIAFSIIAQIISYRRYANIPVAEKRLKCSWPDYDKDVLNELSNDDNSPKALITIVSTKGSVPRKAGAKMLVYPYGKLLGTIGGGCSEGAVIMDARDIIRAGGYMVKSIDMTGYVAEEEGMVCGGIMDVIIESINKSNDF